jgi:murein L,D-transpeptidase YcbB/YkuD
MLKSYLKMLFVLINLTFLAGCATLPQKADESKIQSLKNRISLLEAEIVKKDTEIINLTNILEKEKQEKERLLVTLNKQKQTIKDLSEAVQEEIKKTRGKTYYKSVIKVQTALRNAGFDVGLIDGKMGSRTQEALKEFQKAHGLPADGSLDKQTWVLLQEYLEHDR